MTPKEYHALAQVHSMLANGRLLHHCHNEIPLQPSFNMRLWFVMPRNLCPVGCIGGWMVHLITGHVNPLALRDVPYSNDLHPLFYPEELTPAQYENITPAMAVIAIERFANHRLNWGEVLEQEKRRPSDSPSRNYSPLQSISPFPSRDTRLVPDFRLGECTTAEQSSQSLEREALRYSAHPTPDVHSVAFPHPRPTRRIRARVQSQTQSERPAPAREFEPA